MDAQPLSADKGRGAREGLGVSQELIRAAMCLAVRSEVASVLYVSDLPMPEWLRGKAPQSKFISVVSSAARRDELDRTGQRAVLIPGYDLGREDRLKAAMIGATARGYLREGDEILGFVGRTPRSHPDTALAVLVEHSPVKPSLFGKTHGDGVAPSVFDAVIDLAVGLGIEGWEGHAVGTMFVIGDADRIMAGSRQIALNPFYGYSEKQRNVLDPDVREAVRGFATLDGAFVLREDGVVCAAGRYLEFPPNQTVHVPLGAGARHVAAALVSAATAAIAVVVSQATGKVRVVRKGRTVLELKPAHRRT